MRKLLLREKPLLLLLLIAIVIKVLSLNESWVEEFYTYGFYPPVSRSLRFLFGWIPFSMGDFLYLFAGLYLLANTRKFVLRLKGKQRKRETLLAAGLKLLRLAVFVYLVFNIFWGLNYNRQGIAAQLKLEVQPYSIQDLDTVTSVIIDRLNKYALAVDSVKRDELNQKENLFAEGIAAYEDVKAAFPFLTYQQPSLKPSFYTHIGHFFGFTGYYNPFSGEAQMKTTVPFFLKPFVLTHEIGHQLGYAKENEANFVAYLACRNSRNMEFRYSGYYDLYKYAIGELKRKDSSRAKAYMEKLHPQVKKDDAELRAYLLKSANILEPVIASFYDEYLKMNNQPEGKMTYNQVIAWLIAYQKKYGLQSI